ncbi:MAG: NAD(P)/FAD-dependent oxidoreductase [Proteobacteria bacterium]|nr:NAD(P)/FAD-dependent oxidoreductase [Pseudomonadota bacterium]
MANHHHQVLIVGGGTAGITVAASLRRRAPQLDIAIVEPAEHHYYQPAFTLVGAGETQLEATRRSVAGLVPSGVKLIRAAAGAFRPEANAVDLASGDSVGYDWLVVATGIGLDFDRVAGLKEALGANGVCSNYSPAHAPYTWRCVQDLKPGARAVFTQPPLPFKCPGAPQKAVYMTADYLQRKGQLAGSTLEYYVHGPAIFGVPFFAKELTKVIARYGVAAKFQHNLVAVDGPGKRATFEVVGGDKQGERIEVGFDMLHVSPPQSPPAVIKGSALANPAGWVDVNQNTMQHTRFANVFSLGDVCSTPNSKTAAAVRKQSPVVVRNLLRAMAGGELEPGYDGYASCPLTTARGKAILAEFIYGGKVTPTLPLNPALERWVNWWIKKTGLPVFYWNYMLKGHEWFPKHDTSFESANPPS